MPSENQYKKGFAKTAKRTGCFMCG